MIRSKNDFGAVEESKIIHMIAFSLRLACYENQPLRVWCKAAVCKGPPSAQPLTTGTGRLAKMNKEALMNGTDNDKKLIVATAQYTAKDI